MGNPKRNADVIKLPQRKRLSELYVTGVEEEFEVGEEEPLVLWVQKLTPAEIQKAIEAAKPAKSKVTTLKRETIDHPQKWYYYDQVDAAGLHEPADLIEFLIQPKVQEARLSAEARIGAEDEWAEDDYLEGLQTAWRDELYQKFLEDQEDDEAKRVYEELLRYQEKVDAEVASEERELAYELDHLDYDTLLERVVNKLIDDHGDRLLIDEFRKQQLLIAVRYNEDRKVRYFENREELDTVDETSFNKLQAAYIDISVDSTEGKD